MSPPVRLVAIDMDGTLLPTFAQAISPRNAQALRAAQQAGITVAIATGRRVAYTVPLLEGLGLRADMPLITSNGAVTRTLGGEAIDRCQLPSRIARGLCGLLRPFGVLVFTFDPVSYTHLGLALGYVAAWAGGYYHFIHLSAEVYSIDTLPFAPRPLDGLIVSVVSIGISLLATLYPSSAASRILPAEALRYE